MDQIWRDLVSEFRRDEAFWYFPHASIDPDRLHRQIAVFREFDGDRWSDLAVNQRLRAEKLTTGRRAGTRMLRKALDNAGFCWVDEGVLRLTPAASELLDGRDPVELMERVLWRYELSTPVNNPGPLRLFPHRALLQTLLLVGGEVTRDEFTLFVGRTLSNDVHPTVDLIQSWRELTPAAKREVVEACGRTFDRRARDAGYCMTFHASASYLERTLDANQRLGVRLMQNRRDEIRIRVEDHTAGAEWVSYATLADCVAAYGASDVTQDLVEAVDHYLDTSQFERAVEAFRRLPAAARGGRTVEEFERSAFLERDLEEHLAQHLDDIEQGLVLEGKGRQQPTTVGTMDLFARASNGDLVVIELKKVRASDKVFGQICRYMGWVKTKYAPHGTAVRGYIIGSEIDQKLQYAASVVGEPTMRLKRFRRDVGVPAIWVEDAIPPP